MRHLRLCKAAWTGWSNHNCSRLGAALAYYALFSVAPMLMIVVGVAGLALHDQATQTVTNQLEQFVGPAPAHAIAGLLKTGGKASTGLGATILGLITVLVGAGGMFVALQETLNTIWEVPAPSWKSRIRNQVVSFLMVAVTSLLLLTSMVASMVILAMSKSMDDVFRIPPWAMEAINFGLSFVVITLLFATIYRFLPDIEITWGDTWVGAAVTAMLFVLGKSAVGLYLGWTAVESAYGAAGSLVVLLVWIYYTSQIFLFGAEYTRAYATTIGSQGRDVPSPAARVGRSAGRRKRKPERTARHPLRTGPPLRERVARKGGLDEDLVARHARLVRARQPVHGGGMVLPGG